MDSPENYMLPCLNKKLFGLDCMGCGMQRSVSLIFQGHFTEAFYMYPAIYPLIFLLGFVLVNAFKNYSFANKIITPLAIITGVVIIGNFIFKTFFNTH